MGVDYELAALEQLAEVAGQLAAEQLAAEQLAAEQLTAAEAATEAAAYLAWLEATELSSANEAAEFFCGMDSAEQMMYVEALHVGALERLDDDELDAIISAEPADEPAWKRRCSRQSYRFKNYPDFAFHCAVCGWKGTKNQLQADAHMAGHLDDWYNDKA